MVRIVHPSTSCPLKAKAVEYTDEKGNAFPPVNGFPRFVSNDTHPASIGFRWNKFQKFPVNREDARMMCKERVLTDPVDRCAPANDPLQQVGVKNGFGAFNMPASFTGFLTYSGNKKLAVVNGIRLS